MITEEIMAAKDSLTSSLNKHEDFHSVGLKITPTKKFLMVFLKKENKKLLKTVPKKYEGFDVKVDII